MLTHNQPPLVVHLQTHSHTLTPHTLTPSHPHTHILTLTPSHSHTSHRSNLETIESPERGMEESPLPETPPPGDYVTTAVMQDHVTAASAHLTSHTVTVAGLEQSQLAAEPGYGTPGGDSVSTGEEEGGQTEEDEAEQRERERIRMKEQEDAKRCQVCSYTITITI